MKKDKAKIIANGLLKYLSVNGQEDLLPMVTEVLQRKVAKDRGVIVEVPIVLTLAQKKKMVGLVDNLIQVKGVQIDYVVKPEILDGVRIIYRDRLWDLSLVGMMDSLTKK